MAEERWAAQGAALHPPLRPQCHFVTHPHQPCEQVAGGTAWAPRGRLGPQEHPSTQHHSPASQSGAAHGCAGAQGRTGCPQHPGGPIGMAHARPQQLLGQGMASLPIKPLLSLGHVQGGETPSGVANPPSSSHRRRFASPWLPPAPRAAVPGHNGPFLLRYQRCLGPFPSADLPRQQPRQKNSAQ